MKTQKQNCLVVADVGWAESLPQWIKEAVAEERTINGLIGITTGGEEEVGDAEALVYLSTLSLRQPLSHDFGQIFIYITGACMQKHQKLEFKDLPDFIREKLNKGLSEDEKRALKKLKSDLFKARGGNISHPLLDALKELTKGKK